MRIWLFLGFTAASAAAFASSADEIVRRSVANMEANWKQAPNYSWTERDIESQHGSKKTEKTYEVLMIEDSQYNKLVALNGRPLTPDQEAEQERKLQQEIQKRRNESKRERARRMAKYLKERSQDHAMIKEMVEALSYKIKGETTLDGRQVWILEAEPKPGYVPKTRDAKVLSGMRGTLWIDKTAEQWVKVEAQVFKPVAFYGFLAKVGPGTRFTLEQEPISATLWMPKRFSVNVVASALGFINQNSSEEDTYRNYKPMSSVLAGLTARAGAQ
jgi:hypothetical protein